MAGSLLNANFSYAAVRQDFKEQGCRAGNPLSPGRIGISRQLLIAAQGASEAADASSRPFTACAWTQPPSTHATALSPPAKPGAPGAAAATPDPCPWDNWQIAALRQFSSARLAAFDRFRWRVRRIVRR